VASLARPPRSMGCYPREGSRRPHFSDLFPLFAVVAVIGAASLTQEPIRMDVEIHGYGFELYHLARSTDAGSYKWSP